jgi:hypothetical protein
MDSVERVVSELAEGLSPVVSGLSDAGIEEFVLARLGPLGSDPDAGLVDLARCARAASRAPEPLGSALRRVVARIPSVLDSLPGGAFGALAESHLREGSADAEMWQALLSASLDADAPVAVWWVAGRLSSADQAMCQRRIATDPAFALELREALEARVLSVRALDPSWAPVEARSASLPLPHVEGRIDAIWLGEALIVTFEGRQLPLERIGALFVDPVVGPWTVRVRVDEALASDLLCAQWSMAGAASATALLRQVRRVGAAEIVASARAMEDGGRRILALRRAVVAGPPDELAAWDAEMTDAGATVFAEATSTDLPVGRWWDPTPRRFHAATLPDGQFCVLAIDRAGRGAVVEASWGSPDRDLGPAALQAIGNAWRLAARLRPALAQASLGVHLRGGPELDGGSLGLAVCLAAIARADCVSAPFATGELTPSGDVVPVLGVRAKAIALAARSAGATLMVPTGQRLEVPPDLPLRVVEVSSVADAMRAGGLGEGLTPGMPLTRRAWLARGRALLEDLERPATSEGWLNLADDALVWSDVAPDRSVELEGLRVRLRIAAAVAFGQSGRLDDAAQAVDALGEIPDGFAGGDGAALNRLREVVRGAAAIAREDWREANDRLDALGKAPAPGGLGGRFFGRELGTKGRWMLHRPDRDATAALALLQQAVAVHREVDPDEVARSWLYVAAAHRLLGSTRAAHRALDEAESALDGVEAATYREVTWVYLQHERSRLWAEEAERGTDVALASRAMWAVGEALLRATGPAASARFGLLRVQAWLRRLVGDFDGARASVAELARLAAEDSRPAARRMLAEADRRACESTEVF